MDDGEMTMTQMNEDPEIMEAVQCVSSHLNAAPKTSTEGFQRIISLYSCILGKKGSHKLLRGSKKLTITIRNRSKFLLDEANAMKQGNPEMTCYCNAVSKMISQVLKKYHGLFESKYNYRPLIRKPLRYRV